MLGERLLIADKIALKTFKKYEGCYPWNWIKLHPNSQPINIKEWLSKNRKVYRKTKVPCSCWMCGNPRKWWHDIPLQETRQLLTLQDFEEDIG